MHNYLTNPIVFLLLATLLGCDQTPKPSMSDSSNTQLAMSEPKEVKIDQLNEAGLAIIRVRENGDYKDGVVDANGSEVLQLSSKLLVQDLSGSLALVVTGNKFLFVPLDSGYISQQELDDVNGFQYALPFQCGLAMVSANDSRFYLNADFQNAFGETYQFAESFHHDRALVRADGPYRIINTKGETVAELSYDQVNPQTPWCWQVTNIENGKYMSGFVGLNGELLTEIIYEGSVYYQEDVQRIRVTVNNKHGFLDEHARTVIPAIYEYAEIFDRGMAKVQLDGRAFFIDPNGKEVPE
jgi:hypothetical protein